jgi:ferrochelatase
VKLAVVLFNLGGPDSLDAVEPFLRNLFSDRAVIDLPGVIRIPLASFIARSRAPVARVIYEKLGGGSPILAETEAQARALEKALSASEHDARAFVAMRCSAPFSDEAARAVKSWAPDRVVMLPLYPQFSTTTTGSSFAEWHRAVRRVGLNTPHARVCCYPWDAGFIAAGADLIQRTFTRANRGVEYRLLLSAHGLPKRTIAKGDPYQWQVERTADALVECLGMRGLDWRVSYQSRVGPLEWIGPATDDEIRRAGAEGKGVIVAPIAFVSEHSETLVELDMDYADVARAGGVPDYLRVPAVGVHEAFIDGLARLVLEAAERVAVVTCGEGQLCPTESRACGFNEGRP